MQVRVYRDGKWLHVMMDEEAWDETGKFLTGVFDALTAQLVPPGVRVLPTPVVAVPGQREKFLKELERVKEEQERKGAAKEKPAGEK